MKQPVLSMWLRLAKDSPETMLHIRYVGQTTGRTAWARAMEDLNTSSNGGLASNFWKAVGRVDYRDKIQVFELTAAQVDPEFVPKDDIDLREQSVIALFRNGILNTQAGGTGLIYAPPTGADAAFTSLQTDMLVQLSRTALNASSSAKVTEYGHLIQNFANTHDELRLLFTDVVRERLTDQARLASIDVTGQGLLLMVGSDPQSRCFQEQTPFFAGGSPTEELVVRVLNQLASWEIRNNTALPSSPESLCGKLTPTPRFLVH